MASFFARMGGLIEKYDPINVLLNLSTKSGMDKVIANQMQQQGASPQVVSEVVKEAERAIKCKRLWNQAFDEMDRQGEDLGKIKTFLAKHRGLRSEFIDEDVEFALAYNIQDGWDIDSVKAMLRQQEARVKVDDTYLPRLVQNVKDNPKFKKAIQGLSTIINPLIEGGKKAKEIWVLLKASGLIDDLYGYFHREELAEANYRKLIEDLTLNERGMVDSWMGLLDTDVQAGLRQNIGSETKRQAMAFLEEVAVCADNDARTNLAKARGLWPEVSAGRKAFRERTEAIEQETDRMRQRACLPPLDGRTAPPLQPQTPPPQLRRWERVRAWLSGR